MKLRYCLLFFLGCALAPVQAEIRPASIFTDHMVLQRDLPIPVWGTAAPEEKVTVKLAGESTTVQADAAGKWMVRLKPLSAAENLELQVTGSASTAPVVFTDVAIGEVWICSGQSNMQFKLSSTKNSVKEVDAANYPKMRLFVVGSNAPTAPAVAVNGRWEVCTPASARVFSAVGFFFGRELLTYLNVPIGLIDTSWGGTPAEAWTRAEALRGDPDFAEILKRRDYVFSPEFSVKQAEQKKLEEKWNKQVDELLATPGKPGADWFNPLAVLKDWKPIEAPGTWEKRVNLNIDGVVWLRKVVDVPADLPDKEAVLNLGSIDDFDFTWVNGKVVGHIGKETPGFYTIGRSYKLPAGTLKAGQNVILVRVIDHGGGGGFTGQAEDMFLTLASGTSLPLSGTWQYLVEKDLGLRPAAAGGLPSIAGVLYDGMISPLIPYGIRGAIWYQGEANAGRAEQYRKLFPAMINNWRQDWGEGAFPFYFVQLANFMKTNSEPVESDWAELREAQLMTLSLPHTGMAVTIDIGEGEDIHPKNKQDVGKRLALWALAQDYGVTVPNGFLGTIPCLKSHFKKPIVHSGPIYTAMKVEGATIRLQFAHVGRGLVVKPGEPLKGFAIAGSDKKFVWAEARISGDTVVVRNVSVPNPVAVRYDWSNNPDGNLYNAEGLPASPFRTDVWPGVTAGKR